MAPRLFPALALLACVCVSCAASPSDGDLGDGPDDDFLAGGKSDSLVSLVEARGILRLVNTASLELLDGEVGLDVRAAEHIVARRDARGDIESLAELDAVKWVGPRAFGKLRAYALANGFIPTTGEACLIISEYIEGWGQYNKAVELFNCGATPVDLADHAICLVRNDDRDCTLVADLGDAVLAPGDVTTVCRKRDYHPAALDPIPALAEACDLERAGVMTFSGDDRLLVLRGDGSVADSLGRVGYRPPAETWADVVLDRCDLAPADGVSFYDHRDFFRAHTRSHVAGLGAPPVSGCDR